MPVAPLPPSLPLPDDPDRLPTEGVAAFVQALLDASGLVVRRTALDDFADTVTRLTGDEVYHDATLDQLVTLKRAHRITGRQMARLSVAHLREVKRAHGGRWPGQP